MSQTNFFPLSLTYGHPRRNVPVWLSRIDCKGTETELDQCDHSGWIVGKRKLNFYDLAGVMCYTPEGRIILPQLSTATGKVEVSNPSLRCNGEGTVYILTASYPVVRLQD